MSRDSGIGHAGNERLTIKGFPPTATTVPPPPLSLLIYMDDEGFLNSTQDRSNIYNASLKLASDILSFPSRIFSRIRGPEDIKFGHEIDPSAVTSEPPYVTASVPPVFRSKFTEDSFGLMPSPSGFLTSWYFAGVFMMVSMTSHEVSACAVVLTRLCSKAHSA